MAVTRHAAVRMQQRGVSEKVLDLALQFGRGEPRPSGALEIISIRRRGAARVLGSLRNMIHLIERAQGKTAVVSGADKVVITVYNN